MNFKKGQFWNRLSAYGDYCFVGCTGDHWTTHFSDAAEIESAQEMLSFIYCRLEYPFYWGIDDDGCICVATSDTDYCSEEPWAAI